MPPAPASPRIVWLDTVRLVAMLAVVCCHCCDPFNFYAGPAPANLAEIKLWGAVWGAALRPCVPLFVMITGALLLPLRQEAGAFYRQRIPRVLWPFLIWSVIYALFPYLTGVLGLSDRIISVCFPYSGEAAMQRSLGTALKWIAQIPFHFSPVAVHMWYIYLLIGLYLYLPVFSAWVERASEGAKRWFLLAWAVTTLLPYYREFVDPYLWGGCSWNAFSALYYFAGFNGYLLLGHYLRHHDFSARLTWGLGLPLMVLGWAVTFVGFRYVTALPSYSDELLELFFTYNSLNVALMTAPLFLIIKRIPVHSSRLQALLRNLTACGLGVYIVHYFLAGPCVELVRWLSVPVPLQIPLAVLPAFALSWAFIAAVRRLTGRYARILVG